MLRDCSLVDNGIALLVVIACTAIDEGSRVSSDVFAELLELDSKLTSEDEGMPILTAVVVKLDGTATDDGPVVLSVLVELELESNFKIVVSKNETVELIDFPGFSDTIVRRPGSVYEFEYSVLGTMSVVMALDMLVELVALLDTEAVERLVSVLSKVTFVIGFDELNCISNVADDEYPVEALVVTVELEGRDLVEVLLITVEFEGTEL